MRSQENGLRGLQGREKPCIGTEAFFVSLILNTTIFSYRQRIMSDPISLRYVSVIFLLSSIVSVYGYYVIDPTGSYG